MPYRMPISSSDSDIQQFGLVHGFYSTDVRNFICFFTGLVQF
jgi:5'-3' exonuclease